MEKYLPLSKEIRYLTRNKVKISSMVCSIMIIDMVSLIANRPQLSATLTFFLVLVMLTINNLVLKIDRHYVSRELQCNIPKSIGVGKVTFRDDYISCYWVEKYYKDLDEHQERYLKSEKKDIQKGFLVIPLRRGLYSLTSTNITEMEGFIDYLIGRGFPIEKLGDMECY